MNGKELILYILLNNLEDEQVFKNGKFIGFKTMGEVAEEMNVGVETVRVWINQGRLKGNRIGDTIYIPANYELEDILGDTKCKK